MQSKQYKNNRKKSYILCMYQEISSECGRVIFSDIFMAFSNVGQMKFSDIFVKFPYVEKIKFI